MKKLPPRIVLFDGACYLCNSTINFIIKHDPDHKIHFATMQSLFGQEFLQKNGLPKENFDSFIYIEDEKIFKKSKAYILIMQHLKKPWSWLKYIKIFPCFFLDGIYDIVARNRYRWFGQYDKCMIPTEDIKSRFLE